MNKKHKYFPGNYDNTCAICKKVFHWADKMCFICEDCYDERFTPTQSDHMRAAGQDLFNQLKEAGFDGPNFEDAFPEPKD